VLDVPATGVPVIDRIYDVENAQPNPPAFSIVIFA
jgi:hypothetical protein